MQKIFIDCSFIYEHPELNTGIQRVVRKVIENLELLKDEKEVDITLVTINNNQFSEIDIELLYNHVKSTPQEPIQKIQKIDHKRVIKEYLKNIYRATRELLATILPFKQLKFFLFAPTERFGLNYIIHNIFIKPFSKTAPKKIEKEIIPPNRLEISKGDTLLLLDSTWHLDIWRTIAEVKQKEANVVAVIYDLIPLTHPQFCDDFLVKVFQNWFNRSIEFVDGYIAISNTVEKDLVSYLYSNFGHSVKDKKFDHFLLGSDFNYSRVENLHVREELKNPFENSSTYLIVSTIEPRKNHKYLLDTFDLLWKKEISVNLCIVGKIGWKVEEIMERINYHKELNHKLFHYDDLNDKELIFCYQNAKALLFPSIIEGFGLPIVESLTNHLPVLASNTAIHREVGEEKIDYFNLNNSEDLVQKIIDIEKNGISEKFIPSADYKWADWNESTKILLDKITKITSS